MRRRRLSLRWSAASRKPQSLWSLHSPLQSTPPHSAASLPEQEIKLLFRHINRSKLIFVSFLLGWLSLIARPKLAYFHFWMDTSKLNSNRTWKSEDCLVGMSSVVESFWMWKLSSGMRGEGVSGSRGVDISWLCELSEECCCWYQLQRNWIPPSTLAKVAQPVCGESSCC